MLDVEALSTMIADVIAEEVCKATAPLQAKISELEARELREGPPGEKGEDGKDGAPGFDLEDFDIEPIDERTIEMRFQQGDTVHSFELKFPVMIDRGVWKEGAYERGDAVTWAGSLWVAQKDTETKPGTDDGWRLAVKRGRDGKDAR